jgi:hypothetical protein
MTLEVSLSACGLANIPGTDELNDFVFIVGGSRYRCPWFVADFLSPRVARCHGADFTLREFVITTKDPRDEFGKFMSLGRGSSILIDSQNETFYRQLSEELLNEELSDRVFEGDRKVIKKENVFKRLSRAIRFDFNAWKEI